MSYCELLQDLELRFTQQNVTSTETLICGAGVHDEKNVVQKRLCLFERDMNTEIHDMVVDCTSPTGKNYVAS